MKEYTYLLILIFTVFICFIASFDKRIKFYLEFKSFIKAAIVVAIPFILWDIWFTAKGVWWFDYSYTLGISILGLPLEEWMFFLFIPFSCVFTFYCFDKFFDLKWADSFNNIIAFITIIVCSLVALLHYDKIYTLVTALVTLSTIIYLHFIAKAPWIGRASLIFTVLMLGFFPVNGVLTGTGIDSPIVNYNPNDFLQIRILTIPIEDAVYGYSQFLLGLYFFKKFQKTKKL